jgi:glucose/arabinose dehydrogenase/type 1 glutamine amidotransferase
MSGRRITLLGVVVALGVVALLPAAAAARSDDRARVLVFSETAAFRHGSIPTGIAAIERLGRNNRFEVDTTEDSAQFTDANLARYDAVVWLSTTGDVLDDAQQAAFERYIQGGGGYVGIHSASDTEYDWPWYGGLVGAYFNNHPANQTANLVVNDDEHPSTDSLPTVWERFDEWYNFRANPRGNVHVLLTIDERSYSPGSGAQGSDHPMAWCHAYDGGRAWYTALGHTNDSYSEPLFLKHVLGGIEWAAGEEGGDCGGTDWEHYGKTTLDPNARFPSEIDIAEDGRVFYIEMGERRQLSTPGNLKVIDPDTGTTSVVDTVDVFTGIATGNAQEDGLIGLALDPDFDKNDLLYLFYAPAEAGRPCEAPDTLGGACGVNRLSRFKLTDEGLTDERVVLEVGTQRMQCCHEGGSLEFAPNGDLFISTGDDTNPFESQGFTPIDERAGREAFDAQRTSANTNDLRGKVLRITPRKDGSYSIPSGNLFRRGTPQTRPEIYAMGFRNPFRIDVDPKTGTLFVADYGPDAGAQNADRGPEGRVEWQIVRPGNYGWPYCHGGAAYRDWAFPAGPAGATFDCDAPVNLSPSNTGRTELPPVRQPDIFYGRQPFANGGANVPDIGTGGAPMAGPAYRFDEDLDSDRKFPVSFDGQPFFAEWNRSANNLYTFVLDDRQVVEINPLFHGVLNPWTRPMDLEFGPDGAFYVIQWGHVFGTGGVSTVQRVDYNANPTCLDADSDVGTRTVEIGRIDTTVGNVVVGAGCSINQLIRDDREWRSRERFMAHVQEVVDGLTAEGAITAEQADEILDAAARARIGDDSDSDD